MSYRESALCRGMGNACERGIHSVDWANFRYDSLLGVKIPAPPRRKCLLVVNIMQEILLVIASQVLMSGIASCSVPMIFRILSSSSVEIEVKSTQVYYPFSSF